MTNRHLPITVAASICTTTCLVSGSSALADYISPTANACSTRGCGMTLEEFADRMSFASGTPFKFSNQRDKLCKSRRNLLGYYTPANHSIVMCNENALSVRDLVNTIAHETVHAGQACFRGLVPHSKGLLSSAEINSVKSLYPQSEWGAEFNARSIANHLSNKNLNDADFVARLIEDKCEASGVGIKTLKRNMSIRYLHR